MMIVEKKTLHERTREVTQVWGDMWRRQQWEARKRGNESTVTTREQNTGNRSHNNRMPVLYLLGEIHGEKDMDDEDSKKAKGICT